MCFTLGAILVKGGKIISTGYNHYRTHYDGDDSKNRCGKPLSMHAEMHAIYNAVVCYIPDILLHHFDPKRSIHANIRQSYRVRHLLSGCSSFKRIAPKAIHFNHPVPNLSLLKNKNHRIPNENPSRNRSRRKKSVLPMHINSPPTRLALRSGTRRERRGFHVVNEERGINHQTHHGHHERDRPSHGQLKENAIGMASALGRPEKLIRRKNCPSYAIYQYRDQIARQKEKWTQEERRKTLAKENGNGKSHQLNYYDATEGTGPENLEKVKKKAKRKTNPTSYEKRLGDGHATTTKLPGTLNNDRGTRKHNNGRSRVTGSDLYVVRLTRSGAFGNAMPCWRCMEWCKWAGVKRVFHYSVSPVEDLVADAKGSGSKTQIGKWECVKVNEARPEDCYWTQGDGKILGCN
jgi:hypothetical protein